MVRAPAARVRLGRRPVAGNANATLFAEDRSKWYRSNTKWLERKIMR